MFLASNFAPESAKYKYALFKYKNLISYITYFSMLIKINIQINLKIEIIYSIFTKIKYNGKC